MRWPALSHAGVVVGGGALALLCGILLSVSPLQGSVLLLSMALFVGALLMPWPWLLVLVLGTVGFVVGPLQYAAGVGKAFWLPYLLGVLLGVRLLVDGLARQDIPHGSSGSSRPRRGAAGILIGFQGRLDPMGTALRLGFASLAALAMTAAVSSLVNQVGLLQVLIAGKEYLFLWSLPLAFAMGFLRLEHVRLLWPALAIWLAVQSVVVVWQRFVVAPRRGGDAPWDAVVGLFAGKSFGAGGSGTMALVSLWAATSVVLAWRAGLLKAPWALLAGAGALLACALAEVKVAIVLLPPLALWVLIAAHQPSRPERQSVHPSGHPSASPAWRGGAARWASVSIGLGAALLAAGLLLWAQQQQFSAAGSRESRSSVDYARTAVDRNLETSATPDQHGQLTRLGAVHYWWRHQSASDLPGLLIGHGIGAVRRSSVVPGSLVQGLRFEPGRSSAVVLLWETGVLGLLAWVGSSLGWLVAAIIGMHRTQDPAHATALASAAVIIALALFSLPYGADWFEAPHLSVAYLLGVGMVWAAPGGASR